MDGRLDQAKLRLVRWAVGLTVALLTLALFNTGAGPRHAGAAGLSPAVPQVAQDFQDVPPASPFFGYLHNLAAAGVVNGYACQASGTIDPCVPPDNLPYYHPSVSVTRLQMTKFIDLGRRNIADAVGNSLAISTTAFIAINGKTASGGEGVRGECLGPATGCWAVQGY